MPAVEETPATAVAVAVRRRWRAKSDRRRVAGPRRRAGTKDGGGIGALGLERYLNGSEKDEVGRNF